jgi:hypothetical protein
MKKLLGILAIVGLLVVSSFQVAQAVSSVVETFKCYGGGGVCLMTLTWTAHTDGSVTSVALSSANLAKIQDYYLFEMETDPGSPAPASYGVTLTKSATNFSLDVLGGQGASRSATVTQSVYPKNTDSYRYPPVGGDTWTLGISGATTSGAKGVIRLWFVR